MSILDTLPPSPPSTSSRRRLLFPKSSLNVTSTPESPAFLPSSSSNGARKRVEFSPWTGARQPSASNEPPPDTPAVRALPPSSECVASLKSILKAASMDGVSVDSPCEPQHANATMGEMMESIVQQLARDERTISVDSYQTLTKVIKQYDDIPEEAALKNQITTILKYIRRDLLRPIEEIADTNLLTQALKVLVIFVWNPDYACLLTDEYRVFVLDRTIHVLAEHTAPKSVIMHYLHLLATQNFRPSLLTSSNRAPRLLEALKALSEHIKGNGVTSERLLVYRRLLEQIKATMKAKASLWIEELLTGMTNNMKEVRARAIELGTQTCSVFPASSSISEAVRAALECELENGMRFGIAMSRKLEKMIVIKEEMSQVPQIWAIVVLLSNSVDTRIDDWADLKDWLKVIQRCFNCSDSTVRQQSNVAWNRLVSVVRPHEASDTLLSMLAKPITAQLERQCNDSAIKGSRATAVGSYCNLLYYAFRPAATHKQYTRVWNEYIVKVMKSSFFEKNAANSDIACRIFIALLCNSTKGTKFWNESRALQDSRVVEPEEIPTLDCKWVRAKCSAIVEMFQILLRYSSWGASGQSEKAYIAIAWLHFLRALRDASSKEIKPSSETKQATVNILNFLEQMWREANLDTHGIPTHTAAQIKQMTRSSVYVLGPITMLTALETNAKPTGLPLIFSEISGAILSEMGHREDRTDLRPYLFAHRNSLQSSTTQYEKCLELMSIFLNEQYASSDSLHLLAEGIASLENILQATPIKMLLQTLVNLSGTLTMLLRDESDILNNVDHISHPLYENFVKAVVNSLAMLPHEICSLDEVLAAALSCKTASMVSYAVTMWNSIFGDAEATSPGPKTRQILLKLRATTDVDIPGMPHQERSHVLDDMSAPEYYKGTPSPTSRRNSFLSDTPARKVNNIHSPRFGSTANLDAFADIDLDARERLSSPAKPVSRPRSRHDDSQIHFVQIESSPGPVEEPESQCLTTHQKDVRDRQRSEPAVVFPDLRSSPRLQAKSQNYGDCEFARKAAALGERPSTPTLPTNQQEPEVLASPTPRARHYAANIMDIEVPSSPPSIQDNHHRGATGLENLSSPPQGPMDDAQMDIEIGLPPSDALDPLDNGMEALVDANNEESLLRDEAEAPGESEAPVTFDRVEADTHEEHADAQEDESAQADAVVEGSTGVAEITEDDGGQTILGQRSDSQDIDMLSASQLSQDLDRHLYETAQSCIDDSPISSLTEQPAEGLRSEEHHVSRSTRKRKASALPQPARKRRAKSSSRLSAGSAGGEASLSQSLHQQDLLDTIEVISSPIQAPSTSNRIAAGFQALISESAHPPRRRRGRPRKSPRQSQSEERRPESQIVRAVVIPRVTPLKTEPDESRVLGIDTTVEEHIEEAALVTIEREVEFHPVADANEDGVTRTAFNTMDLSTDAQTEREATHEAQPAFLATLQSALEQLKSNTSPKIDLRSVDELCFQIRFIAQTRMLGQHP